MKQRILFEGDLDDLGLDDVLPELISKAKETGQDVFVHWNNVTIRVRPTSKIHDLLAEYEESLSAIRRINAPIDGRDKVLYKITNGLGIFYVVSRTLDEAAALLQKRLDRADYGYTSSREVKTIEVLAIERFVNDKQLFGGDRDNLVIDT